MRDVSRQERDKERSPNRTRLCRDISVLCADKKHGESEGMEEEIEMGLTGGRITSVIKK